MKRILDLPDDQIAERVALRAACNRRAGEALKAARKRAEEAHYQAQRAKTSAAFPDDVVRDAARMTFKWSGPDTETQAQIDALKAAAEEALPSTIKSYRVSNADCACAVQLLEDEDGEQQTFAIDSHCEAHAGLSIEELHDARMRERTLRARAHRLLSESCAESFGEVREGGLEWRWEGMGISRKLCVESCHMTNERAAALAALAEELGEPGAIEATATRQE